MTLGDAVQRSWPIVALGTVCTLNPRRPKSLKTADDEPTTFVPMTAIDERSGSITGALVRPFAEVRKGYTYFEEGDVLFAKITPCMQNGKHAIAKDLLNGFGFGSTEFHVIRPGESVTSEWIHAFVRQRHVLEDAKAHFTGAVGQQRVPDSYLSSLQIPLPPLEEQRRIVARLNEQMAEIEKAWTAALEQRDWAAQLPQSILRQHIDDADLSDGVEYSLADVCEIVRPMVDPRLPEYSHLPHVFGEVIETGTGQLLNVRSASQDKLISGKFLYEKGDVLYSKLRPYLRKVALPQFAGLCSADMYPLTVKADKVTPDYLMWLLLSDSFTDYALTESGRARMPKLNRDQLFRYRTKIPRLERQREVTSAIESTIHECKRLKKSIVGQLCDLDSMSNNILKLAFQSHE